MFFKEKLLAPMLFATMLIGHVDFLQAAPDTITVAGGATGAPLMIKASEQFVKAFPKYNPVKVFDYPAAVGFKNFCTGNGVDTPSLTTSTRKINSDELKSCNENGVKDILQFSIGSDAMVIAQMPRGRLSGLTLKDMFLAIAKEVPDPKDHTKLIPNPYRFWKDINPNLPDIKIQIKAPSSLFGLNQAYSEMITAGCKQIDFFKKLETTDQKVFQTSCKSFRKDGYTEYDKISDAIQEIKANSELLGFLPFSVVLKENLRPLMLDDIQPAYSTISEGHYKFKFDITVYVKKSHVGLIQGLKEYLIELTSENATGFGGYFLDLGIVYAPLSDRKKYRAEIEALKSP